MQITDDRITLRMPDNWHHHFRADFRLEHLIVHTAKQFQRVVAMPNLPKRVLTGQDALRYEALIKHHASLQGYPDFEPVMTIYLTEKTTPQVIHEAHQAGVRAVKIYPKGGTTESGDGIVNFDTSNIRSNFYNCLNEISRTGILCLIHCEVPDQSVDPQEREQRFMPILRRIHAAHPDLKIVVEHISSREAVETVLDLPDNVAATVTCHHLFLTNDDIHDPHNCCMPIAKFFEDRARIRNVVLAGNPKFFYGGDDAPHHRNTKEGVEHPAHGVWCGPTTMPLLVEFFKDRGELSRLEAFVSQFGAEFYGMPLNDDMLTLVRKPWKVPENFHDVVPFRREQTLEWQVE